MPGTIQLTGLGLLTDADGNLIRGEHDAPVQVATDAITGKRYQKVCFGTPGKNAVQRSIEGKKMTEAGAIHVSSENSDLCGWWEPVVEAAPAAIAPPAE